MIKLVELGYAWVAQWLSICLRLRVRSRGPEIESTSGSPTGSLLLPLPMSLPVISALLMICISVT